MQLFGYMVKGAIKTEFALQLKQDQLMQTSLRDVVVSFILRDEYC